VITSYNRNFTGRLDGNRETSIFISSPEMVIAKTFAGDLSFDPINDTLPLPNGKRFSFQPPRGESLPDKYEDTDSVYTGPSEDQMNPGEIFISPDSERIQRLQPFGAWNGSDYQYLPILIKVKGKCTTDHITPGGPWFKYRGHLDNISNNTLIGATNAANDEVNSARNVFTGTFSGVAETARDYKRRGQQWVIVADHNYGEGSSREHAALQPRFLNGVAVIAKSLPRLHEANLKKQGMLPLTFVDESDYDRISPEDRISLLDLQNLGPGSKVRMRVTGENTDWTCELEHTFSDEQVHYFKHGSALNYMGAKALRASADELRATL
jgi:aconitate hydratase